MSVSGVHSLADKPAKDHKQAAMVKTQVSSERKLPAHNFERFGNMVFSHPTAKPTLGQSLHQTVSSTIVQKPAPDKTSSSSQSFGGRGWSGGANKFPGMNVMPESLDSSFKNFAPTKSSIKHPF